MNADWLLARGRTVATLVVLGVLFVVGVSWGWAAVTEPFPEKADTPLCVDTTVEEGDPVRPAAVTVSVLNAGGGNGLAGRTLNDLEEQGFARGQIADAPDGTKVKAVQIFTAEGNNAAVKLLRTYLGGKRVQIIETRRILPGLNVVIGSQFTGVRPGRGKILAEARTPVCTPPALQ